MPIRTSYAKKLYEKSKEEPESAPVFKRKRRPTKDTRWMIMIDGKQRGDIMNTTSECYVYIEKHNLSDKLPQIQRVN